MNSADGLFSGRASAGAVGVPAPRPESGQTERLPGTFLFPNAGPDDHHLGREAPPPGRVGALFATAGAQRGATPGVVRVEKGVEGLMRAKFPERDPDSSFKFNAVIEEFERSVGADK